MCRLTRRLAACAEWLHVSLEARELSVDEHKGSVTATILRTSDFSTPVTVALEITGATANGATAGVNFGGPLSGSLTFAPGQARASIEVPIFGDAIGEPMEIFGLSIAGLSGGSLQARRTARLNILDDEVVAPTPVEPPLTSPYGMTLQRTVTRVPLPSEFAFSPVDPSVLFVVSKHGRITVHDAATGAQTRAMRNLSATASPVPGLLSAVRFGVVAFRRAAVAPGLFARWQDGGRDHDMRRDQRICGNFCGEAIGASQTCHLNAI